MARYAAVTTAQQAAALTHLIGAGQLKHCRGMTLEMVLQMPLAARIVNLHAMLIAQGKHPALSPKPPPRWGRPARPPPITKHRPAQAPSAQAKHHYFDARSAAAGDLNDKEED